MAKINEIFGSMVFNDAVMKERLPKATYAALKEATETNKNLTVDVANVVAAEMKNWALERGATHFAHWFQPLTGVTAEKHDAFISPVGDGTVIMDFSGKELIKGEPDGSSFPSGGIRATFEARGYTNWDPTSYAFIKEKTLCIPTAFFAYGGEALDEKTPLLRSMDAVNKQALRIVKLFGMNNVENMITSVGPEQEYFLVDREVCEQRPDLVYCGRTLFGAKPPKRQELADHYFGAIKPRVKKFMEELNEELWKIGILSKTEHNEVAPAQHEIAPIYTETNVALDHNQITMEILKKVAKRHDMVCLLHEKPFAGVNGSGKHTNWSIATDTGINLLKPGSDPENNKIFQLMLAAVIQAVDDYQDLLRVSVASAGNDHRLGGNEAPPAIISIFLGDEIGRLVDSIISGAELKNIERFRIDGATVLPAFQSDTTDRNRTSPFAFTGNRFEFRMTGSEQSIGDACFVINTIVAESLMQFADKLEAAEDFDKAVDEVIKEALTAHHRIIFNGDNYTDEWVAEADRRGLLNLTSTVDAAPYLIAKKNVELFKRHRIFSEIESTARYEIKLDEYAKLINIEALTMIEMAKRSIAPSVSEYCRDLANTALAKKELGVNIKAEKDVLDKISDLAAVLNDKIAILEEAELKADEFEMLEKANYFHDEVIPKMNELRLICDELETMTSADYWPFPGYGELLFSVK
ncbi:MAG: glutamine synthetase type III [Firmicutes bacterium]|nr:glutamine synthetase type III [Bacillota bacterium]